MTYANCTQSYSDCIQLIFSLPDIQIGHRKLLKAIAKEERDSGRCLLTNDELAERLGTSARTVQRYKAKLKELGWLEQRRCLLIFKGQEEEGYKLPHKGDKTTAQLGKLAGFYPLLVNLSADPLGLLKYSASPKGGPRSVPRQGSEQSAAMLEKTRETLKRKSEITEAGNCVFKGKDAEVLEIAKLYDDMASFRFGRKHHSLGNFKKGILAVKSHRNWKHFEAVLSICERLEVEPREWLEAQFIMVSSLKNDRLKANKGVPFPSMLHGKWALERFKWYLDKAERALEADGEDYVQRRTSLTDVWDGPMNLAERVSWFAVEDKTFTVAKLMEIMEKFPNMFEPEYIITHPLMEKRLYQSSTLLGHCGEALGIMKGRGAAWKDRMREARRRSLKKVEMYYPEVYEEIRQWL